MVLSEMDKKMDRRKRFKERTWGSLKKIKKLWKQCIILHFKKICFTFYIQPQRSQGNKNSLPLYCESIEIQVISMFMLF